MCVTGPYEGLFYIDNDQFHVYRYADPYDDEPEIRLKRELSYDDIASGKWLYDEWGTGEEQDDVETCFVEDFTKMFPSFTSLKSLPDKWIRNGAFGDVSRRVLMESKLFYVCIEDNEWSLAVELIQKEDPYDNHLLGLQKRHCQKYLDGIKKCLLSRLPSIGTYTGAWTSETLTAEEFFTAENQAN